MCRTFTNLYPIPLNNPENYSWRREKHDAGSDTKLQLVEILVSETIVRWSVWKLNKWDVNSKNVKVRDEPSSI